ncbi:hypothetical protein FOA52_010128 [Chlamydomonas sp. UWO 241]|nr:hypothetical protein FOA52_010128 [Chlamydomonas sp. UWO 241]
MASSSEAKTGLVWHELYMWHDQGPMAGVKQLIQPTPHWESPETKRRMYNLLAVSGMLDQLAVVKPRAATMEECGRVHDAGYLARLEALNADDTKGHHVGHHVVGEEASMAPGGFGIALLSAGGCLSALDAVMAGTIRNAYCLVRPPGHHAERDRAMGFCFVNNIAVVAAAAIEQHGLKRVAIVDWDVHHGNGTQHMLEEDPRVLFISLHQDSNYPQRSGYVTECGVGAGEGTTINVPLPPGCGSGAYRAATDRVVVPALDAFRPQLILVSSGFDAAAFDPLSAMMLSSDDFRYMATAVSAAAERHCAGRMVCCHEGGYSEIYVPFCGLAVIEALSGINSGLSDPMVDEINGYGYQSLQPHQDAVLVQAEGVVARLVEKMGKHAE